MHSSIGQRVGPVVAVPRRPLTTVDIAKLAYFHAGRTYIEDRPCISRLLRRGCAEDECCDVHQLQRTAHASLWRGHRGDQRLQYVAHGSADDAPLWELFSRENGFSLEVLNGASWLIHGAAVAIVQRSRPVKG